MPFVVQWIVKFIKLLLLFQYTVKLELPPIRTHKVINDRLVASPATKVVGVTDTEYDVDEV